VELPGVEDMVALHPSILKALYDSPYPERIFRIEKNQASAVTPDFEQWARDFGWKEFGICGFTSNVCVARTAADICRKGLGSAVVLEDVCAEHKQERIDRGDHEEGMSAVRDLENGHVCQVKNSFDSSTLHASSEEERRRVLFSFRLPQA